MAKVTATEGLAPKVMYDEPKDGEADKPVKLSLLNGVGIIVGVIVGSGIFVSPNLALKHAGSKGMALMVWFLSGCLSTVGAYCYAELGTMIPKSGGDYAYIGEAFGGLPSFMYLWGALFILVPCGNAVTAKTFAQNILKPFWPECNPNVYAVKMIAAFITCFLTVINCYNVKWVTRMQDSCTIVKVLALLMIFFTSIWYMFSGHTENLENMMDGTILEGGSIATAFMSGLFSYSGWNYLNFVTEQLKEPYKNLPRAIIISMPIVTIVYLLTNLAFFAVLTNREVLASESAVAVIYSEKILGSAGWIMPVFVALCTMGSLHGAIFASSHLFFVGARNGHLPRAISLIDVTRRTPVPSLIFMCMVTLVLLLPDRLESLVVCVTAVETLFIICSVSALLWMRKTRPNDERPIRVSLFWPVIFLITFTLIFIFTLIKETQAAGFGVAFVLLGIPMYFIFIKWDKPEWLSAACDAFTINCEKLFMCLPEDSKDL